MCPSPAERNQVYEVRLEILDKTIDMSHGHPRDDFDVLTLTAASCTVGGVLDAIAGLRTTSWSTDRPHPYVLALRPGEEWRNANEARDEALVDGTRLWYPLLGRWSAALGSDST